MKIGQNFLKEDDSEYRYRHDYFSFYNNIFNGRLKPKKYPNYIAFCPFHKDTKTPNLLINIISGRFKCYACGAFGDAWDFIIVKNSDGSRSFNFPQELTDPKSIRKMVHHEAKQGLSDLDMMVEEKRAIMAHEYLFEQPLALQHLHRDRGLTDTTIRKYKIGFMRGSTTFPIYDIMGHFASLKFHKQSITEGSANQLFPWESVWKTKSPYVILSEGEFDTLILLQNGFNAVTQTWGANSWDSSFTRFLRNKIVYIAYDNDSAGRKGAEAIGNKLWAEGISVQFIQWPMYMGTGEDHIDFFVKHKKTAKDYDRLLKTSKSILSFKDPK